MGAEGGGESLIELQNTLITTVSHIPALNASHTQYEPLRGKKKNEKKNTQFQPRSAAAEAIIIKHPCICVQTIPQLLALILYMQRGAEKALVDPRAPVSPPTP